MPSAWVRKGVSHGSGRCLSAGSIGVWCISLGHHNAWPWGGIFAITYETILGRSVGMGTESPWYSLKLNGYKLSHPYKEV
jgi:hypothetical protein